MRRLLHSDRDSAGDEIPTSADETIMLIGLVSLACFLFLIYFIYVFVFDDPWRIARPTARAVNLATPQPSASAGSGNMVTPRPVVTASPAHHPPLVEGNRVPEVAENRCPPPAGGDTAADALVKVVIFSNVTSLAAAEEGCVICLSQFKFGEELTVLPTCNHGFHVMCIESWWNAATSNISCPTCRRRYS